MRYLKPFALLLPIITTGCATVSKPPTVVELPTAQSAAIQQAQQSYTPAQKVLKRKVAIGRFTNETRYGKTFLRDGEMDPLGKQASDMLSTRLVDSGQFIVFERPDLSKLEREAAISGPTKLVGVDTLILGSVTEFGRTVQGTTGFLSQTKTQIARAKVELRLVDTKTGQVYFSATGAGTATTETGSIAGYGSRSDYDDSLNDRAIGAAISEVQNSLIQKLQEKPWRTDILTNQGNTVFVSGGARQGIKIGDTLGVYRKGKTVTSAQSGFDIELPPTLIAKIQIISQFGQNETNEGSQANIVSGSVPSVTTDLFVGEAK
ncbi:MAG: CsgG/HfaB family protein [Moraxellaceae bacterium]|nr:CsgG/HfaB family protein [Moraxellaceae bacterium]MDZ4386314.1 CsgG/HfaB family protein [Moraxellaceae bacterium]